MSEVLVSVKMLTYNHAPHIAKAIECVLAQKTDFAFELVIGEDCSTDGTREIVFDYARRYPDAIRVVASNKNVGSHINNNRTRAALRGKYIAWCEGDDYWQRKDKLQLQVDYLEAHPECGLVYSDYDWHFVKSGHKIKSFVKTSGKDIQHCPQIIDIVTERVDIRTCTVLAKHDLISKIIDGDKYLHQSGKFKMGDIQLWAELSLISEINFINESLATYQILEESATQSKDGLKRLLFWISASEMYLYLCEKHNLPEEVKNLYENNWRRGSLQLAFFDKQPDLAESIKRQFPKLPLKDWVWYIFATTPLVRPIVLFWQRYLKKFNKDYMPIG